MEKGRKGVGKEESRGVGDKKKGRREWVGGGGTKGSRGVVDRTISPSNGKTCETRLTPRFSV